MSQYAQAIMPGGISVGDIVRAGTTDQVPYSWQGVMAEVIHVDGMNVDGDSLTLRAVCGTTIPLGVEDVEPLNVIDRLAWSALKSQADLLHERLAAFKAQRNRENEWVTSGEVVRFSDSTYPEVAEGLFKRARSFSDPLDIEDIEWGAEEQWSTRVAWCTGRVVHTPTREGEDFTILVLTDENPSDDHDWIGNWVGMTITVPWMRVFRIESTPEDE